MTDEVRDANLVMSDELMSTTLPRFWENGVIIY